VGNVFESWTGQPVIVHLALSRTRLSLRGMILKEWAETLQIRPRHGPDLEIRKAAVLAIEQIVASAGSQWTRTFAALKGVGVGVGPLGGPR
jgi:hypothetical protein